MTADLGPHAEPGEPRGAAGGTIAAAVEEQTAISDEMTRDVSEAGDELARMSPDLTTLVGAVRC